MRSTAVVAVLISCVSAAWADDVYTRTKEKPYKGVVKDESAKGVQIGKDFVPADDIVDVEYEVTPIDARVGLYRPAVNAEKEANDPGKDAKRKANLAQAIKNYEDCLTKLDKGQKYALRHVEYKVAVLMAQQAREENTPVEPAATKLKAFCTNHKDSWQIAAAMKLLAGLHLTDKQYSEAAGTYSALASQANVSRDVRLEAEILAAIVPVRAGNHAEGLAKIEKVMAGLPKDHPTYTRARIAQAECLVLAKEHDKARAMLKQILKETNDKTLRAMAYNTVGMSLFLTGQPKEARWEFLWVDVVYNQDKAEHAKALYYLWQIFAAEGDGERAQECFDLLQNDRQFAGLEYQLLAVRKAKMP